jgi:large subunit ribosomal protein L3
MRGLIGRKAGMTQVFDDQGRQVPATVLEVGPCVVVQKKIAETDGYNSVQYGFEEQTEQRAVKPQQGHFKKAGVSPRKHLLEFRDDAVGLEMDIGDVVTVSIFEEVNFVDVAGVSKGRGFQGVVKRYGMGGGRKSHGAHTKRSPGSVGASAYPANIEKGKHMPGHMGNRSVRVQNLAVIQVLPEDNLLVVRGAVPGPTGRLVVVTEAVKRPAKSK